MTIPKTTPTGLTAADAEWFEQLAASRRAANVGVNNPAWTAQNDAEAFGLEAMAAALRDPAARGVPTLRQGVDRRGSLTPCGVRPWRWTDRAI